MLLDLFCGKGGAALGYFRAGFDLVGVDIVPQPKYPFPFVQADALRPPFDLERFDAIHASPPCQGYSRTRHLPWLKGKTHPLLIPAVREMLQPLSIPWVIENVGDAPLDGITLRGGMFGLPYKRARKFESNILLFAPPLLAREPVGKSGHMFGGRLREQHGKVGIVDDQSIPIAYSVCVGEQLMAVVQRCA